MNNLIYLCKLNFNSYIIMNNRIFQLIESKNMTQSDFASKTGISPSALTQLKNKEGNLSIDNVIKIKIAFPNVSYDWLISGVGEMCEHTDDSQKPNLFSKIDSTTSMPNNHSYNIESNSPKTESLEKIEQHIDNRTAPTIEPPKEEVRVIEKIIEKPIEKRIKKIIVFYDDGKFDEINKD